MQTDASSTLNTPQDDDDDVSLNDGLDLPGGSADEEARAVAQDHKGLQNDDIFQDPEPGEIPDLKADIALLDTRPEERALEDLHFLLQDIRDAQGMSQAFALEAERIAPGFLTVPVGYYTKAPTVTRLKVSMEGLIAKVWEMIKKALAKLKELFLRFVYFLAGRPYPGDAKAEDTERQIRTWGQQAEKEDAEIVHGSEKVADTAVAVANEARKGVQFKRSKVGGTAAMGDAAPQVAEGGEEVVQWSDLDRIIGELLGRETAVQEYMLGKDAFFSDLIYNGPFTKTVAAARPMLADALNDLHEKTELLSVSIRMLQEAEANGQATDNIVSAQTQHVLLTPLRIRISTKNLTLSEFSSLLDQAGTFTEQANKKPQPIAFEVMFGRLTESYRTTKFKDLSRFLTGFQERMFALSQLYAETAANMEQFVGDHASKTGVEWSKVIAQLNEEAAALGKVGAQFKHYHEQMRRAVAQTMHFGYKVAERMLDAMAGEQTNPNMVRVVQQLQTEAEAVMKQVQAGGKFHIPGLR